MRRRRPRLAILILSLVVPACGADEPTSAVEETTPSPILGTWDLDAEALVDSYVRMAVRELEAGIADGTLAPEAHQSVLDQSRRHAAEHLGTLKARFVFVEDGTFASTDTKGGSKGTWTWQHGALELIVVEQAGAPLTPPATVPGTFEDDVIRIRLEPDKDYVMTLRRVTPP